MILIYGKGKVGKGLAKLCDYLNIDYTLCDDGDAPKDMSIFSAIIPSPGIPGTHTIFEEKNIICELDFVHKYIPAGFQKICITGTDGKSTTCHIIHQLLTHLEPDTPIYLTGNSDVSLSTTLVEILKKGEQKGILVIEVSSFMGHIMHTFMSDISTVTNLHPDHLDWHRDLDEYYHAKKHLLEQTKSVIYIPKKVAEIYSDLETPASQITIFNDEEQSINTVQLPYIHTQKHTYTTENMHFRGYYNASNVLVACLICEELGHEPSKMQSILDTIKPLAHRAEQIAITKSDIHWIEDSKSTTSQSQRAALDGMPDGKTILIAGGKNKGDDFLEIESAWKQKCKHLLCIGETRDFLANKASKVDVPHTLCDSLEEAVHEAHTQATEGDYILFSPGCSSFDMFADYLDRANAFRSLVEEIQKKGQ